MSVQNPSRTVMQTAPQGFAASGGFRIRGKTISNLRYADGIVLVATSPEELQDLVSCVEKAAKEYNFNMIINAAKTKDNSKHS